MREHLLSRHRSLRAQTLVEYAILLGIISVLAVAVMISMSSNVRGPYAKINSGLSSGQSNH